MRRLPPALALSLLSVLAVAPGEASANHLCGVPLTTDTLVTHDHVCTGDGIVIGASRITVSFTNAGTLVDGDGGLGDFGIDNTGGFANVTVNGNNANIDGFSSGVFLVGARRNDLFDFNVNNSVFNGVDLNSSSANTVFNVQTAGNALGINLGDGSNRNLVKFSAANSSATIGINVLGDSNDIIENEALSNASDGIRVGAGAARNLLQGNNASNNTGSSAIDGIDVASATTKLTMNSANNNGGFGINAVAGVRDGGGNTASGNGAGQCLNVAC